MILESNNSHPPRPTTLAQAILDSCIGEGDLVIDATAGNGHDTVFLAERVGGSGKVVAFDIQEEAIRSAGKRVGEAGLGERVVFHCESHAKIELYVDPEAVSAVMFNLGYLPGEDHELTTAKEETMLALGAASRVLKPGGILSVVCYPGHPSGAVEAVAVEAWLVALAAARWRVSKYGAIGTRRQAPFLLLAAKSVARRRLDFGGESLGG